MFVEVTGLIKPFSNSKKTVSSLIPSGLCPGRECGAKKG